MSVKVECETLAYVSGFFLSPVFQSDGEWWDIGCKTRGKIGCTCVSVCSGSDVVGDDGRKTSVIRVCMNQWEVYTHGELAGTNVHDGVERVTERSGARAESKLRKK